MINSEKAAVVTYKLPLSSSSSRLQQLAFTMTRPGPNPRQSAPHPHSTFTDPSGRVLLSADLGADLIRIFSIDAASGKLTACPTASASPGDGPRHGAFWGPSDASDSNINMLYTVNELSNSVTSWTVTYPSSSACLTLTKKQTLSTFTAGKSAPNGSKASEVHVRGNVLYVANRFDKSFGPREDSLVTYTINPSTGDITYRESVSAHAYFPRTFEINAAGNMIAVGGQTSSNVAVLERNVTDGRIGKMIASVQVGRLGTEGQEDGLSHVIWVE
jgi:6-phosphogluconolactonase (cycloisomerase 2 family)